MLGHENTVPPFTACQIERDARGWQERREPKQKWAWLILTMKMPSRSGFGRGWHVRNRGGGHSRCDAPESADSSMADAAGPCGPHTKNPGPPAAFLRCSRNRGLNCQSTDSA